MSTNNTGTLNILLQRIDGFRRGDLSLGDLKSAIWETAQLVSSHEERQLREALQHAEGQLDMIQFTIEDKDVHAEALKVVDKIEALVKASITPP